MAASVPHVRLNIYLDDPGLRRDVKIAAVRAGVSVSEFCVTAIRHRLAAESSTARSPRPDAKPIAAARALDRLRRKVGRIGIPVRQLVEEGRRR